MRKNIIGKVSVLAASAVCAAFLAACGGGSSLAGTYTLTSVEMMGVEMNIEDVAALSGLDSSDFSVTIELKDDGSMVMNGEDMGIGTEEGTWKENGDSVDLTSGGETMSAEVSGNSITLEEPTTGMTMIFEK